MTRLNPLQQMAQHQLKAINRIGMQTSRILKTVQLLIERKNARKATEDPSINNNFFLSIHPL